MIQNINGIPDAYAKIIGDAEHSEIQGNVYFYGMYKGTLVVAEIYGLPNTEENGNFYGFHIHEGKNCTGNQEDSFKNTGGHYNLEKLEHPKHKGDLPPILSNDGIAWSAVYTERFYPEEIVGKTIVVHDMADDFKTQPSGNSGKKIACGEIV